MLLTESYKKRLKELAGIKINKSSSLLKEVEDMYANSSKRVKFDKNIMTQAIEGGLEVGMVFQSNNSKYKMPIWKMRIIQPVAMGYDKKGELVIRAVHVTGQSEKKALAGTVDPNTGERKRKGNAEAENEWRLFRADNIKSMFLTGNMFDTVSLPGYNPQDSAMTSVTAFFDPKKAADYQKQLKTIKSAPAEPVEPVEKPIEKPAIKSPVPPKPPKAPVTPAQKANDEKNLKNKIDKLNKLI
jgi:hypothetical protein